MPRDSSPQPSTGDSAVAQLLTPEQEARRLFRAIFRCDPPAPFCEWFAKVPDSVFPLFTEAMWENYRRVLRRVRDLEALEYASRLLGRNRVLVHKMLLTVYLAECCPEVRRYFVNRQDLSLVATWAYLTGAKLYNFWKLIKGLLLLLRYHGP